MILKSITLLAFVALSATTLSAQTDSASIQFARNSLDVAHNCENALHFLSTVSETGKKDPQYNLLMGRTHDCKMNRAQAAYYYNKYLETNPGDDSVKKRVAELKDFTDHSAQPMPQYANGSHHSNKHTRKKRRHFLLSDNFASVGLGYARGLGDYAPYGQGICFDGSDGFPVGKIAIIDVDFQSQLMFSPNMPWFKNAFGVNATENVSASDGYNELLTVGFLPIVMNTHKTAFVAGAFAGLNVAILGSIKGGGISYSSDPYAFSFCYGVKACYFLGESVMFTARLNLNTVNTVTVGYDSYLTGTSSNTVKTGFNTFSIGVSYKFDPSYWWWW